MTDIFLSSQYVAISCASCGCNFALSKTMHSERQSDHRTFFCPNGHHNYYPAKSDAERLKDQIARMKQNEAYLEDRIREEQSEKEAERRRASAARGQVTKIRNRVGRGVCPCCNRTFSNLARHMEMQHKGYHAKEVESA